MEDLYQCDCEDCNPNIITLSVEPFKKLKDIFISAAKAFEFLFNKKSYQPKDLLTEEPYQDLVRKTNDFLGKTVANNVVSEGMQNILKNDVFIFSHLRTHAQLMEASSLLLTEDGKLKPFYKFKQDIAKINDQFNDNYLQAEYQFAMHSTKMAERWARTNHSERYVIMYRTANDDKVRASHQPLHGIALPSNHPFWDEFYPPNGWRCRCTTVQTRSDKVEITNDEFAMKAGRNATSQVGKDGKNRLEIFRFNPGKQKLVFPPKHPYNQVKGADEIKKNLK
ncbi:phage minor head protein [Weeksella virosa]|uniref:phage head morphogenesis protein n=2 Tax=Weeksella virosa TaxID=1014 RepID=UPI0025551846|nr:phage minor head protein [Weeksella virosa]MDK7674378.1 phage minor head protein [Weeksella virosa]